jgi:hypothetical protein
LQVADLTNSGTITNTYGVHVGDITTGTQTNTPFSFYASDANAFNYFGWAHRRGVDRANGGRPSQRRHRRGEHRSAQVHTAGTNLTTAEAGAMEYNGTNLFFTRAGTSA